ncbi:hypothetical protein BJV82DRAFT_493294, partial [Fennellomyces sp. T-0311]
SDLCTVCRTQPEDLKHFIFKCLKKKCVWCKMCPDHLSLNINDQLIQSAIFKLHPPQDTRTIPSDAIVDAILLSLWRAHWALFFDQQPF